MAPSTDFTAWQRQHALGMLLFTGRNLLRIAKAFWPLLFTLAANAEWALRVGVWAGFVLLLAVAAFSVVQFRRFGFRIRKGALHVRKGVFQRSRLVIPLERVQAVHLKRNPIQRALGLTGLSVDTAGSKGSELELVALRLDFAQHLQQALSEAHAVDAEEAEEPDRPLFALNIRELLRVGLSMNHLRSGLVALALPLSLAGQIDGLVEGWIAALPWWALPLFSLLLVVLWFPALLLVAGLGVVTSLVVVVIKYFGLRLDQTKSGQFSLQSGLLNRVAFTIHRTKVQTVQWTSTPLTRALGMATAQWSQARAGGTEGAREGQLRIPGVPQATRQALDGLMFPDWNEELPEELTPQPIYGWVLWARWWIAGALLGWWSLVAGALVVAFGAYWSFRTAKARMARCSPEAIAVYQGWWKRRVTMTQVHQVQRAAFRQSFWHAYRGIAHVTLFTAAGNLHLRFLPAAQAQALVDYVLFETERSDRPWM